MLSRFIVISLMISIPAFAADNCDQQVIDQDVVKDLQQVSSRMNLECPNNVDVQQLCNAVSAQLGESNPTDRIKYQYQTLILNASCVESSDQPAEIQAKVQNFWNKFHDSLNCSQLGFSIRNGHILKLAVEKDAKEFVNDAVRRWKVSLNHIDPADNKTVLDYIQSELNKARGTSNETILQRYFTLFKNNGAKLRSEL